MALFKESTLPRRKTRKASPYRRMVQLAAGVHDPDKKQSYLFRTFVDTSGQPTHILTIGRAKNCDIHLRDDFTSKLHAELHCKRTGEVELVRVAEARNGLYIDGKPVNEPVTLEVGMRIRLGKALLYAIDERGIVPYSAENVDDYLGRSADVYGNNTIASERIGRSREAIRQRREPSPKPIERVGRRRSKRRSGE